MQTTKDVKNILDELANRYENENFIKDDPVQFVHKFKKKEDIEVAGFIASLLAFGKRELFIKKMNEFISVSGPNVCEYIKAGNYSKLKDFNYRFVKPSDFIEMLRILGELYKNDGGLEELFKSAYDKQNGINFKKITDYFYSRVTNPVGQGFYFMLPDSSKGGAMKRMNMFLRWMIRKSAVDVGIWNFMQPFELLIPLDVHVGRVSRKLGLTNRKANDFKSVLQITAKLKEFCPEDPIKYDFAMFGFGVNSAKIQ